MTNLAKRFLIKLNHENNKYFFILFIFIKKILKILFILFLLILLLLFIFNINYIL
jgi:hypothetical protein